MRTNIIITTQCEGFHLWEDAKTLQPEVAFLSDRHRHIFFIEAKKFVTHHDRDIEIILLKREIEAYIERNYGRPAEFGKMSCEMIAQDLQEAFDLDYVSVREDNENGAEVCKD